MSETNEDLSKFGIRAEDELVHPAPTDEPSWNESVFFDWYHSGTRAGHVRIGRMPNQHRVWLWVYVLHDGEWLVLEEPRLPIGELTGEFEYDRHGLAFSRTVVDPVRSNRLEVSGIGRIVSGPRSGRLVPFDLDLVVEAVGPAHSLGESSIADHSTELFSSNRFEQPMRVRGHQKVGDVTLDIDGHGERDHSWGPRFWNMEWFFLVAQRPSLRFQCARVVFDEDSFLTMGYLGDGTTVNVGDVEFDLRPDDENVRKPYAGRVKFETEDGRTISATIEALDGCEIDASHVFDPPQPSIYRRAVVRVVLDDGSEPLHGWLEINRFPGGIVFPS